MIRCPFLRFGGKFEPQAIAVELAQLGGEGLLGRASCSP